MTFSVIIPTYNRRNLLEKAVDSVLAQTFADFELIIADDGSTDHTKDLIGSYQDSRVCYVYQENSGPASARNLGIQHAQAQWIAFLDSDDWWLPQKLQRAADFIQRYPDIFVFHTQETWYRQGKLLKQKNKHRNPDGQVYEQILPVCCISMSTAVIHRKVLDDIGCFDESFPACEDYELLLRITARYPVKLIPEALTEKDGGRSDELSVQLWGLDRFRIKALTKMLDSGSCGSRNVQSTIKELVKKCSIFANGARKRGRIEEAEYYSGLIKKYV